MLVKETENIDFWNDTNRANKVNQEISNLRKDINTYNDILDRLSFSLSLCEEDIDEETLADLTKEYENLIKEISDFELKALMNGPYDKSDCYVEIHPGAGGTESCDWASMLHRMYTRYCEIKGFSCEVLDLQKGDEAGIKSLTMLVKGYMTYALFKHENGVHRLVRISPFDSNKRRHTSFASVLVTPEYNIDINIEIKESDLKIDVYHSSGAGGQSVNTSNSAVRITHLPTKTVVTCQQERSQLQNKERAMKMLKNKLYELELQSVANKMNDLKGTMENINFGSQIRSYVLEPYKLIKDNRSNYETSNVLKVLDGELLPIIESVLKTNNKG